MAVGREASQPRPAAVDPPLANLTKLIEAGGQITVGRLAPIACVAIAHDGSTTVAMLRRQAAETVPQLLERLDAAVAQASRSGLPVDDINA